MYVIVQAILQKRANVAFSAVGSCHLLDADAATYAVVSIADSIVGACLLLLAWDKVYLCYETVIPVVLIALIADAHLLAASQNGLDASHAINEIAWILYLFTIFSDI